MSDHLSEDDSQWPSSAFEVLGVDVHVDRTQLRRVYSKLILRFRPETHPRQFQRIREAFELVLRYVDRRGSSSSPQVTVDADRVDLIPPETTPGKPVPPQDQVMRDHILQSSSPRQTDAVNVIWERFSRQPEASQLNDLRALSDGPFATPETFLAGYWMLHMRPEFAVNEAPVAWLLRGLPRVGLDHRFVELIRDEYRRDPALARRDVSEEAVRTLTDSQTLITLLSLRWSALGQLQDWNKLAAEIDHERPRISLDHPDGWFWLILRVAEMAMFCERSAGQTLLQQLQNEVQHGSSIDQRRFQALDHLDVLHVVRIEKDCRSITDHGDLNACILEAAFMKPGEFRQRLFRFVADVIQRPVAGLNSLSLLLEGIPEAFHLLEQNLSEAGVHVENDDVIGDDPDLHDSLRQMLRLCQRLEYRQIREFVAIFCVDECVDGKTIVSCLGRHAKEIPQAANIAEQMSSDRPLMMWAWLAVRFLKGTSPKLDLDPVASG